jgi:hypothetical protein
MKTFIYLIFGMLLCGCYSTHSKTGGWGKTIIQKSAKSQVFIEKIIYKVTYDSLDYRIFYGMKNDPDMLSRGLLFDTMRIKIREGLSALLSSQKDNAVRLGEIDAPFFSLFTVYGKEARIPRGSHEFHRSPWFDYHKQVDSVILDPNYSHLSNTLVIEFKLLKMYRDGRGGVPGFEADVFLRFAYINEGSQVQVYRNFLVISSKSIDGGVFRRLGNENIDWWRPRHIDELMKRMQYELGITDKKGRPVGN